MRISDWNSDVCSSDLPGLFLRYLLLIQYRIDSQSHLVHVGHAINSAYNATRFIDRQDRRRFGSIFLNAGTNRFLIFVGAPLELRTAPFIANTLPSRPFRGNVIAFPTCGEDKPAGVRQGAVGGK